MSDCRQCADFDWCVEYEECGLFKQKPMTNADRIRAMTDEELADWFSSIAEEAVKSGGKIKSSCWLGWLKQEVET